MFLPNGVHTVLVTPFTTDNKVDYVSLEKLLATQLSSDVVGLVLLGTTSEGPTVSQEESVELVKFVWERASGKKFVTVGVGGNNTAAVVELAGKVHDFCDGYMVTVPAYNKPSQEGIYNHFVTVASAHSDRPVLMYNIPSRTGVNMTVDTMVQLDNDCENIVAVKEASGDISQVQEVALRSSLQVFSGNDDMLLSTLAVGGVGVVSVASNLYPNLVARTYHACSDSRYEEARRLYKKYLPLVRLLFTYTNPVPLKVFLAELGVLARPSVRLPMVLPEAVALVTLVDDWKKLGLSDLTTVEKVGVQVAAVE